MSESTTQIAPNTLKNIATEARSKFNSPVDRCFQISLRIQELLDQRFDLTVGLRELQMGEPKATHFVNTLPMKHYSKGDTQGKLLIDGSISQFTTQYADTGVVSVDLGPQKHIPQTALYEPGCEERLIWYCLPNDTELTGELSL
jgi:hypothetical protein